MLIEGGSIICERMRYKDSNYDTTRPESHTNFMLIAKMMEKPNLRMPGNGPLHMPMWGET